MTALLVSHWCAAQAAFNGANRCHRHPAGTLVVPCDPLGVAGEVRTILASDQSPAGCRKSLIRKGTAERSGSGPNGAPPPPWQSSSGPADGLQLVAPRKMGRVSGMAPSQPGGAL